MRGEFIGVWAETWREIWQDLATHEDAPDDLFCELYREFATALKDPSLVDSITNVINDPIQSKEAFERALTLAGVNIALAQAEEAYNGALKETLRTTSQRKEALENVLSKFCKDSSKGTEVIAQALSDIAADPVKRMKAFERIIENIINDKVKSRETFERTQANDLAGERTLVDFLETAHGILDDVAGDALANHYFNLLAKFIDKFSLRYDLRRPCILCPTLPGVFANLIRDLRTVTSRDAHLDSLMKDFENAIRDLRMDSSDGRIKTCIQKQVNLLEALGQNCPGVTKDTLEAICGQVGTWPHEKVREAMENLYKFTCNYPGIRHGGTPASALCPIEMRDMIAMCILLVGFSPYLTDQLDANLVYRGA